MNAKEVLDKNGVLFLWSKIKLAFVAKETGKGLSTNDLTNDILAKINAQVDYAQIENKPTIPTKVSQLANDSNFQNVTQVSEAITTALSGITGVSYSIPEGVLPSIGEVGVIYLIPKTGTSNDTYEEYIWINSAYEYLGTRELDLSNYLKTTDIVALSNEEIEEAISLA